MTKYCDHNDCKAKTFSVPQRIIGGGILAAVIVCAKVGAGHRSGRLSIYIGLVVSPWSLLGRFVFGINLTTDYCLE